MNFILAIGSTLLIVVVLTLFRKFESKINKNAPLITIRANAGSPITGQILECAQKYNCTSLDFQVDLLDNHELEITFLAVGKSSDFKAAEFVATLEKLDDVIRVGILNGHK